jgi:hypothetical protein
MIKKFLIKILWKVSLYLVGLFLIKMVFNENFQCFFVWLFVANYGLITPQDTILWETICIFLVNFIFYLTVIRRSLPKFIFRFNIFGEIVIFLIFNYIVFLSLFVNIYR